ncbi:hypothetical protein CHISP_1151 [Chitinispirillum alkaliphilum]|nr:hypothetical protein CHISP_1151 [Chitinispirillum alkaliphilum]
MKNMLMVILTVVSFAHGMYFIQIKASTDLDSVLTASAVYREKAVPFVISETISSDEVFYRLRLGGFANREDAQKLSDFLSLQDVWIVHDETAPADRIIKEVFLERINFCIPPSIAYYQDFDLICLYDNKRGFEAARAPGDLYLFSGAHRRLQKVTGVTGFIPKRNSVILGIPQLIAGPEIEHFSPQSPEIKSIAEQYHLPVELVLENKQYFEAFMSTKINIEHELDLTSGEIIPHYRVGCDFYDNDESCVRVKSYIEPGRGPVGNGSLNTICMEYFACSANYLTPGEHIEGQNVVVLTLPDKNQSFTFFALLFK